MEKACRLTNITHWDIAPSLYLPSLPVFCGALDPGFEFSDDSRGRRAADAAQILASAGAISGFLSQCDVSYLKLKDEASFVRDPPGEPSRIYSEVLKHNSSAFQLLSNGFLIQKDHKKSSVKPFSRDKAAGFHRHATSEPSPSDQTDNVVKKELPGSVGSRKPNLRKKTIDPVSLSASTDSSEHEDAVANFCELVEDFCGKAEGLVADQGSPDGSSISVHEIRNLVNEILSIRSKKLLQLIPIDTLLRLLASLDYQIRSGLGLSIDETADADAISLAFCSLDSTYAALALMTYNDMPKKLYNEEVIERILDLSRHQIMDCISACDTSYRAMYKPNTNETFDDVQSDEDYEEPSTAQKKRNSRVAKVKKSTANKMTSTVDAFIKKLCSILGFLKDLLSIEKLPDSCILQLMKTSFSTFMAENIDVLQIKAIDLICGVFALYTQHRSFLIDETVQLVWKLSSSRRAARSYHLPDVEEKQIQMITALIIQLVQCSANLPEIVNSDLSPNSLTELQIDVSFPTKCHKLATETCCHFWTSIVERVTTAKSQDMSESKVIIENLVLDLLSTLNLPEYPASATILEVLCVLLLQNSGLKSKDVAARCVTVDLLGTIAARLKRDAINCRKNALWSVEERDDENGECDSVDECAICLEVSGTSFISCHVCQRVFHAECMGVRENLFHEWSCHICASEKQLSALRSYCKTQSNAKKDASVSISSISRMEVIQQILLNYLQETGSDDVHVFTCWFYLCLWYKDSSLSKDIIVYAIARLKSKLIVRDINCASLLSRDLAKQVCLALGQKNSFSRGFDKILSLILASLRENSPVLRAKALRAVSGIVEVDPEVLCDRHVQTAVEGRFCDSAISVREAALELVGRHIASHPDVGLKYFEKVAERIKDTGVSVRKRAIKIIRDMCISNTNFSDVTSAFFEIISRVGDEESSIQDLVCKVFYEFWFEDPPIANTLFVSDGSSVPLEVAKKTEQLVDLLRKMPNNHLLITVIRRNLTLDFLPQSAKAAGLNNVLLGSVRRRCELMCKHLLERVLQVEEATSDEEVRALPYVLAIQTFCVVDPTLCAPATDPCQFVTTLQPYLKNQVDSRQVAQLLECIIFIMDSVLPLLRRPPQNVMEDLEQDLKHMIARHSYLTVVHACIKCLCSVSRIAGKGATLVEYFINSFLRQLDSPGADNKKVVGRSLFCLGLLIRYGNSLLDNTTNTHSLIVKCLDLIKHHLQLQDFSLKVRSLQAMGYVFIARPEYMLEMDVRKILTASLSSGSDKRIKMQALQNLLEYLHDVENQMAIAANADGRQCIENGANGVPVPVAAGAGDTNICGGIIQLYWENILDNCLDVDEQVRQSTLKIVEIVLRQGLVHPITPVPYLIALETDTSEANTKLAHQMLVNLNERYPSFFESRLGDGLQMSFRFFQILNCNDDAASLKEKGKSPITASSCVKPGISRIYRLIRANRNSRNKFMHSIIRKFEIGYSSQSSVPFLIYCTEVLSSLPFTCPDEPLYLIYDINRVLQLRSGALESNLKMWSSFFSQDDGGNYHNEDNAVNGDTKSQIFYRNLDTAVKMASESQCGVSRENSFNLQADCHDATALKLLLKLKRYLKMTYSLNDTRCQAFSPKEYTKTAETLSRQSVPVNFSDIIVTQPDCYKDFSDIYQEFKQLLKEDTMDYSLFTSSIKRKRPTPKPARGRPAQKVGNGEDEDGDEDMTGGPQKPDFCDQANHSGRATKPTPRSTRGRPAKKASANEDDDDDYDDEDWTGGPRKLDFSDHANYSGRITRQRAL